MDFKISKEYVSLFIFSFFLLSFFSIFFFFFTIIMYIFVLIKLYFTKISIKNEFLFYEDGIFFKFKKEINIKKINNIAINQNFIQKTMNVGDIKIISGNDFDFSITNLGNFSEFVSIIKDQVK